MDASPLSPAGSAHFSRDRFTWASYGMFACFACLQSAAGTVMPQLLRDLSLDNATGALHMSAFALGMIAAGVWGDLWIRRLGGAAAVAMGSAVMGMGALLFCVGRLPAITVTGMLVMGVGGTLVQLHLQAALSRRHGLLRTVSLAEATMAASLAATTLPLLVKVCERSGWGWRFAIEGVLVVWALLWAGFRRPFVAGLCADASTRPAGSPVQVRAGCPTQVRPRGHLQCVAARVFTAGSSLPRAFWMWWVAIVICQGVEWCMVLWAAVFFQRHLGWLPENASAIMGVLFLAAVVGRWLGSRLARRVSTPRLYFLALAVAAAGFPLFWEGPGVGGHVAGLALMGLGVSNLFPVGLSLALEVDPTRADEISARVLLGAGLAILVAPLMLGWLADHATLDHAYLLVVVLIGAAVVQGARALREQRFQSASDLV